MNAQASKLRGKTVAIVGPCANNTNCQMGDYNPQSDGPITTPPFRVLACAAHTLYTKFTAPQVDHGALSLR